MFVLGQAKSLAVTTVVFRKGGTAQGY